MDATDPTISRRGLLIGTAAGGVALASSALTPAAATAAPGSGGPSPAGGGGPRRDFPVSAYGAVRGQTDSGPAIRRTIADAMA